MASIESRHLAQSIARTAADAYSYACDPANLPEWAAGLSGSIEQVDGAWMAESPMGRVRVEFAARNDFGVLDHDVTLPSGETFHNPVRVISDGDDACEVVFTLRRAPGVEEDAFAADEAAIRRDLATLRDVLLARR